MVHPLTQVQYIDIKNGQPRYKNINELYQEYSYKVTNISNNISEIDFTNENVKITELFGWTQLLNIRKIIYDNPINWVEIKAANKFIDVSYDELIPIYKIDDSIIGFHGEVKYKYNLKHYHEIINDDYIRIYRGKDNNNQFIEFTLPEINNTSSNISYGYEIITKSRFFNGNDIHLYSSDIFITENNSKSYK